MLKLPALTPSQASLWASVGKLREANLLRLAILRDFARIVHAQLSTVMATPPQPGLDSFSRLRNTALEDLEAMARRVQEGLHVRTFPSSAKDWLKDGVSGPMAVVQRTFPPEFFEVLGPDRIERYDRAWEREIAAEAVAVGWELRSIEAWVEILEAQAWEAGFVHVLGRHGVVLFAESAFVDDARWKGRWIFVSAPGLAIARPAGAEEDSKLLFPKANAVG